MTAIVQAIDSLNARRTLGQSARCRYSDHDAANCDNVQTRANRYTD